MKKVINSSISISYEEAHRKASKILRAAQSLLDLMDDTPYGFLDNNDLGVLYNELVDTIPSLSRSIDNGSIEY